MMTMFPLSPINGSRDGSGSADHDLPFHWFGRRPPRTDTPYPFSSRQYLRLLCQRAKWHELRDRVDVA